MKCRYIFAGFITWVLRDLLHYRRDVVMTNLARSFPERRYGELRQICDDFYRNMGDTVAEALWFGRVSSKRLHRERLVEIEDISPLQEIRAKNPNGCIMLDSHCFNWELMGGFKYYYYRDDIPFTLTEHDVLNVYKRLRSKFFDRVFRRNRLHHIDDLAAYDGYLEESEVVRHIITHRGEGRIYDFKSDQAPGKAASIDIGEFMHQPTRTLYGGVYLARKYHMSVVYYHVDHDRRGHYTWRFSVMCEDAATRTPEDLMREYYDRLQADIERNPSNYLWTHKRWK